MARINVRRLLGVPYVRHGNDPATGLDCAGAVACVLRDHFGLDAPIGGPDAMLWSWLQSFDRVGTSADVARELGDVVVTGPGVDPAGVYAVIDDGPCRRVVTAQPSHGVRVMRLSAVCNVIGVYRWRK